MILRYAVQSTRIQIDKEYYSLKVEELIEKSDIDVVRGRVASIFKQGDLFHVELSNGDVFSSKKIIVTTGTF